MEFCNVLYFKRGILYKNILYSGVGRYEVGNKAEKAFSRLIMPSPRPRGQILRIRKECDNITEGEIEDAVEQGYLEYLGGVIKLLVLTILLP